MRSPSAPASRDMFGSSSSSYLSGSADLLERPPALRAGLDPAPSPLGRRRIESRRPANGRAAVQPDRRARTGAGSVRPRAAAARRRSGARARRGSRPSRARRCPALRRRAGGRPRRGARARPAAGVDASRHGDPQLDGERLAGRELQPVLALGPEQPRLDDPRLAAAELAQARRHLGRVAHPRRAACGSARSPPASCRRARPGPPRSSTARSQSRSTEAASWETNTIVPPRCLNSKILPKHLRWNSSSPTANTSSRSSTSASICAATANPSRMYMPDEYVRTGRSMKSLAARRRRRSRPSAPGSARA